MLQELLRSSDVRLLTLVGPPGVGKTRLGLAVAHHVAAGFVDEVVFVPLAALATAEVVGPAIAQALGILEPGSRPLVESLCDALGGRSVLLVLDNFEHVLPASSLLAELLANCPRLKLLVTSRVPTRLSGEREVLLHPLGLPALASLPPVSVLADVPSVAVFVERAQAIRSDFVLTRENAASVAEICVRLDGLPLAIELAAARVRLMTTQDLVARLNRAMPLLTQGTTDSVSPHHRTLREAIAWSHDLLEPVVQMLFRRLAVFSGGWTLSAAEIVCGSAIESATADEAPGANLAPIDVLDGLTILVEHSLVERDSSSTEQSRFRMLETVHAYASELLAASGEDTAVRRRHAEYVFGLAQASTTDFVTKENVAALARLDAERDNVRAALYWCAGENGPTGLGLQIVAALHWYWYARGHFVEGRRWFETMLAAESPDPTAERARAWALFGASTMAWRQADYQVATRRGEQALAAFRALADEQGIGLALISLGVTAMFSGDYARAERLMEETLAHGRATGNDFVVSSVLHNQGRLAWFQGDLARATARAEEALPTAQTFANTSGSAYLLSLLADIAREQGAHDRAETLLSESMTGFAAMRDAWGINYVLYSQGLLALARGRYRPAAALLRSSLERSRDLDDTWLMPQIIAGLAVLAARLGHDEPAARLFSAAERQRTATGAVFAAGDRAVQEHVLAETRQSLGHDRFDAAWVIGQTMTIGRAVSAALDLADELAAPRSSASASAGGTDSANLTPREQEVAALVAGGLSNRQISERLVLSERTVERHIENIYRRLGISGRAARAIVTTYALRHRLIDPD